MNEQITDSYKGWSITVTAEDTMCAHFSFSIADPNGKAQHVSMGGHNALRALERAKEMIDLELSFTNGE